MEKRMLGKTGMEVSVLGFGGAEIGYEGASQETVERLLGSALDAGLNIIDTAECYDASEELIGNAVSKRRNEFYLFTKCGHASGFDLPDWDVRLLEQSIDRSLQRLKVDHVDLVQLHSCSEDLLRQGDVIAVLQRARDAGKTRFIGYSGDSNAALYAVECGAFDTLQTSINIADQEPIELTLPRAKEKNMGVIAKRPIANVAWRNGKQPPDNDYARPYWERLQELGYPFLQGDKEQAVSTALRFTLSQPAVCTAIVGTKNPERWQQNAALLQGGPLSTEEQQQIRNRWHAVAKPDWTGRG
ncbi:MAG: aldo/keto reductase [Abitibacteriaceae bacterium]|nr:aldo/keto reductase [Abditibacteriaceae bacterium]MBV9867868.1 aldo/keto reductase [Abditibacteriaceae bacterium]